jgi:predicted MPP superfamily phosphohydrolase
MIIAQISDTHIALDSPDADQRIRDFELTIADINVLDPAPDVIVHTGDIVHNGRQDEYRQAVATLAKARAPVYVLAGNKDSRVNLREALCRNLALHAEFVEYAIDDYPVRLIALDTLSSRSNKGDFCLERVKHLIEMVDSVSVREDIESHELVVIQEWWPDSGRVTDVDDAQPQALRPQPIEISERSHQRRMGACRAVDPAVQAWRR